MNMITRLFSSFDPIGRTLSLNYLIILLILIIPTNLALFNLIPRNINLFISQILKNITSELEATIPNKNKSGKTIILFSIFMCLIIRNLMGLIPYVFTITAHIIFTLRLALPFWLGFILFRSTINTNHFLSHLVPLRTPLPLSQFIVLIESVRQLIRPITLSVRLAANITAGHILIGLCRSTITIVNMFSRVLLILIILETAVAIIQSYVFTVLITIYIAEAYDKTASPLPYSF